MLRASALLLLVSAMGSARAQTFVVSSGSANPFISKILKVKEARGIPWFPPLSAAQPRGSLIVATGTFYTSDLWIMMPKERLNELEPKVTQLLGKIGRPQATVRIRRGFVIGSFDLDFENYLERNRNTSRASIPLGAITAEVSTWGLDQPLGIAIDRSELGEARLAGRSLGGFELIDPNGFSSSSVLEVTVERHWYGLAILCFLAMFLASMLFGVIAAPMLSARRPSPARRLKPSSLAEAQSRYEEVIGSRKYRRAKGILLAILAVALLLVLSLRAWGDDALLWLPPSVSRFKFWAPALLLFLLGSGMLLQRRANSQAGRDLPQFPLAVMAMVFVPVLLLDLMKQILDYNPLLLVQIPRPLLIAVVCLVGLSPLPMLIVYGWARWRKATERLGPGDADYDTAMELARKSGVRVRCVVVLKEVKRTNAFARIFGMIGLTQGARENLSPEKRRSMIAHELGHLKAGHVPKLMATGVGLLVIWFAAIELLGATPLGRRYPGVEYVLTSPLLVLPLALFARAPFQRRAEFAADKFALECIGSFDEVATALAKVHLLNASPHTFRRTHEALMSHPSLTRRLEALRQAALALGMAPLPGAVQQIIESASLR